MDFLARLFDTSGFPRRWDCGTWTAWHGWLHVLSDLGVWSAYVAIPCVLGYFVVRRRDVPFRSIFWLFGAFILACGTTHLMEAILFWWPVYRLAGLVKLVTALVSWTTVLALVPAVPRALSMRGPEELEREIVARKEAELALEQANAELQQQVEALRASEERFRLLVDGSRDHAIFMLDAAGRVASWNTGAQRIKQYRAEEIVGQHFSRFYPPEAVDRGWPDEELRRAAAEGRYEEEGWRLRKDGSRFWANVVLTALRDEGGGLRGFSKITRDMTERKRAEESARRLLEEEAARRAAEEHAAALWEERERLRVTLRSIGDGVIVTDAESRATFLNPVAEALTGWKTEEAAGHPLLTVFPIINERTRQAVDSPVARVLATGHVVGLANHTVLIARDGTERPIDDSAAPIRAETGRVVGVVLVFRDVTERRRQEDALRASEQRLRLLWESASVLLTTTEPDVMLRELFARIGPQFGLDAYFNYMLTDAGDALRLVSCVGIPDDVVGQISRLELGQAVCGTVAQRRQPIVATHVQQSDDPKVGLVKSLGVRAYACNPLQVDGTLLGTLSFASRSRDRLEEDELELLRTICHYVAVAYERLRLVRQLREADRRKDEFLATLAHELRNPLAPLRTGLELLRRSEGDAVASEQARGIMERQIDQMVRLVDDLLDVSRISRGKVRLRKERVELQAVVRSARETVAPLIQIQAHELTVALPPEPVHLDADSTRLAQVLANLLSNAAKYTERGGRIWLTGELASRERERPEVVVTVKDTGIGIPADHLPRLFQMFSQAAPALERSQGGLGIGLSLVRGLVELHGGSVEARSDGVGRGSEFIVRLPVAEAPPPGPEQPAAGDTAGGGRKWRVLVVDDNRDAADALARMLRLMGHEAHLAHDGPEAIQAAEALRPEVVLLDIGLPKMNGYDVARHLRRQAWGAGMTLIALTGWGGEEDRRRSAEAGMDEHLTKPVGLATLEKVLAGLRRA